MFCSAPNVNTLGLPLTDIYECRALYITEIMILVDRNYLYMLG